MPTQKMRVKVKIKTDSAYSLISFPYEAQSAQARFEFLQTSIRDKIYSGLHALSYHDEDGDEIRLQNSRDLTIALIWVYPKKLRILVSPIHASSTLDSQDMIPQEAPPPYSSAISTTQPVQTIRSESNNIATPLNIAAAQEKFIEIQRAIRNISIPAITRPGSRRGNYSESNDVPLTVPLTRAARRREQRRLRWAANKTACKT